MEPMMSETNRQWIMTSRPAGMVAESNFELRSQAVPEPGEGQVLVRNQWLAFEPAMRGWMEDRPNYIPPVAIGEVMRGMTVGEVVKSGSADVNSLPALRLLAVPVEPPAESLVTEPLRAALGAE